MKNKALFLDRDGVIVKMYYNRHFGTIDTALSVKQIEFVPGIFDLLQYGKKLGYLLILISNQPAVGIKKLSLKHHTEINDFIAQTLDKKGVGLNGQYCCIHHPYASIAKYRKECDCRKPKVGLLMQAAKDHKIDLKHSWMIGDGVYDIIAGHAAGCKTILLGNIREAEYLRILEEKLGSIKPTALVKNMKEAITLLNNLENSL